MAVEARLRTRGIGELQSLSIKALNPTLRAYVLALLSTVGPSTAGVFIALVRRKIRFEDALSKLGRTYSRQLLPDKFAAVCAYLVGGATLAPLPLLAILDHYHRRAASGISSTQALAVSVAIRYVCTFVTAVFTFRLLNKKPARDIEPKDDSLAQFAAPAPPSSLPSAASPPRPLLAGRTLDLTLFGVVRAGDVVVKLAWDAWKQRSPKSAKTQTLIEDLASPSLFAMSSGLVMWVWFHYPERLPAAYNAWISAAAQVDKRLIEALRQCRFGNFVYGKETGYAGLLGGMCKDLQLPEEWGDPAKTIPIPEQLYHAGAGRNTGHSCEWHAIKRFYMGWQFAMRMYLPLNLVILLRRPNAQRSLLRAFVDASQSSCFLGFFIMGFYYGVCLGRKRLLPHIFDRKQLPYTAIDGGACVGLGCALCGWSILMEKPVRRKEIAFFVLPRALATLLPRRYDRRFMGREEVAFATSAAVILTAAQYSPRNLHGVFGRVLGTLFV